MLKTSITFNVNVGIHLEYVFIYLLLVPDIDCIFSPHDKFEEWKCVPVKLKVCKDVQYNETINMGFDMKNPFTNKESQEESKSELDLFEPLLRVGCSKHLRLFLCSVYLPYCSAKVRRPITACRPLCEEVKRNCYAHLKRRGDEWPANMDCTKFPLKNEMDKDMCLDGGISQTVDPVTNNVINNPSTFQPPTIRKSKVNIHIEKITSKKTYCRVLYSKNNQNYFFVEKLQACALDCLKDGLFTFHQKQSAERWLSALSCICGLLCVLSLAVVVFEYHNTCYPERTIIFIAACYLFYSLAYIIRMIYSREGVTCKEENGRRYLLIDGSGNLSCAATFLLTYCFSMAQNIWWVMLSFSWFLSAGLKWRPASIRSLSMYFHVIAWGVPCAKTVIILVIRKIDVNELTGICYIGNRYENLSAMRIFVLGPLFTFLVMGMIFLLFGFITLFHITSNFNDESTARTKLERPLLPVGIYAALHTFFSTFIFASYIYEYANKSNWYHDPKSTGPNFEVFLVRIIMDFLIGITASIWLLAIHLQKCLKRKLYQTAYEASYEPATINNIQRTASAPLKTRVDTSETSI